MKIPPRYRLTKRIALLLASLEANKQVLDSLDLPREVEENLRQQSILGSSLYSARVEGNTLTADQVSSLRDLSSGEKRKLEVSNLQRAISYVLDRFGTKQRVSEREVLRWHRQLMKGVLAEEYLGEWRRGHEGVFDKWGTAVYHAPPPALVPGLVGQVLVYVNGKGEKLVPIKAILGHLMMEKIHPFVDGSGRVGRLLQLAVLATNGYAMKGLAVVEEEIDSHRSRYYRAIEESQPSEATGFVELMLEFLVTASGRARDKAVAGRKYRDEDFLPPRRQEILKIIRDQKAVSLDFIHRRFREVDPRLLRYDLKALADAGFIKKVGTTRGVLYRP